MLIPYLIISAYWLALSFATMGFWLRLNFGKLTFEQILYFVQLGINGAKSADPQIFLGFLGFCLLLPFVLTIIISIVSKHITQTRNLLLASSCMLIGSIYLSHTLAISEYLGRKNDRDHIAEYYVEPTNIQAPSKKRNLILIYVESLENTYSNKTIFNEDLLSELTKLPGESFAQFKQINGANWTIASMVSSMCGVPLKGVYTHGTGLQFSDFGSEQREFLPNLTCLGDILQQHGYINVYMGGAGLDFGAKGKFLSDHGYTELIGRDQFAAAGIKDFNKWGLFDYQLFAAAKLKVAELAEQDKPYNLTLLTLDTHTPYGYISPYCQAQGANNYKGVVKCSAKLISDFISYLNKYNYLNNTQLVIIGDHLVMSGHVIKEDLNQNGERMVYNKFILNEPLFKNRDSIVHLDLFPTILNILGFSFANNQLALGVSGFGATTLQSNQLQDLYQNLMNASTKYYSFWQAE